MQRNQPGHTSVKLTLMSNRSEQTLSSSKSGAVQYFHDKVDRYAERYSVPAHGDVLWSRHHAILHMVHNAGLPPAARIIDLGCGPGILSLDLAQLGYRGVGLDGAAAMVARCRSEAAAKGITNLWQYEIGDV